MPRMRIGDMLVKAGLIDEMQLSSALAAQKQWGGKLGDILVNQGFLDEPMLWLGLSTQLQMQLISLTEIVVTTDLLNLIPVDMCERLDIFPVARDDRSITIATSEPNNVGALDEVAFRTGAKVKMVLAPQREVTWAHRFYFRGDRAPCPPPKQRRQMSVPMPQVSSSTSFEVNSASTPISELRRTLTPRSAIAPASSEEQLRAASEMLKNLVDACVQRGLFTREDLAKKLRR